MLINEDFFKDIEITDDDINLTDDSSVLKLLEYYKLNYSDMIRITIGGIEGIEGYIHKIGYILDTMCVEHSEFLICYCMQSDIENLHIEQCDEYTMILPDVKHSGISRYYLFVFANFELNWNLKKVFKFIDSIMNVAYHGCYGTYNDFVDYVLFERNITRFPCMKISSDENENKTLLGLFHGNYVQAKYTKSDNLYKRHSQCFYGIVRYFFPKEEAERIIQEEEAKIGL